MNKLRHCQSKTVAQENNVMTRAGRAVKIRISRSEFGVHRINHKAYLRLPFIKCVLITSFRLLTTVYPKCAESQQYSCFIMDQSGFLVMHPDFMLPSAEAIEVEHVHITQKEKSIAIDLINRGYLITRTCRNVENIREQRFYELRLPQEGFSTLQSSQGCKYELSQIPGTNVYLG